MVRGMDGKCLRVEDDDMELDVLQEKVELMLNLGGGTVDKMDGDG